MKISKFVCVTAASALMATSALASPTTTTSPTTAGALPAAVTEIGGLVFDFIGLNGARVVSQIAASTLYVGFAAGNPLTIGSQSGYTNSITDALGGGIAQAAVRVTLQDGDTAPGDFDDGENDLFINGVNFGDFSDVATITTDSLGNNIGAAGTGFEDDRLDTGFFFLNDTTSLAALFASIVSTQTLTATLFDVDPGDNFFDFTQGIDGGLINVGSGPVITPPNPVPGPSAVPLPAAGWLMFAGLGSIAALRRRRKSA